MALDNQSGGNVATCHGIVLQLHGYFIGIEKKEERKGWSGVHTTWGIYIKGLLAVTAASFRQNIKFIEGEKEIK